MCGLFGFMHYGETQFKALASLTNALAKQSAARGTDAAGIAFIRNGIQIQKEARSALSMTFKHPDAIKALIGHTRHATHGNAKKNYNNHPFFGKAGGTRFALAHNGVLLNSFLSLPKTKIETDSYAAVQLLEQQKKLTFDSLRHMAETVSGSFSFSILDEDNSLWLVKGDSPLSVLHFLHKRMYVYASTDEILYKALIDSPLFEELKKQQYESIAVDDGTILKITADGRLESDSFTLDRHDRPGWWEYGLYADPGYPRSVDNDYLQMLRSVALFNGFDSEQIDALLASGFTLEEIEEAIYAG